MTIDMNGAGCTREGTGKSSVEQGQLGNGTEQENVIQGIHNDVTLPPQPEYLATTCKGREVESKFRKRCSEINMSERDYREVTEDIDFDLLDPDYVTSKQEEIFQRYQTTREAYFEECRKKQENDSYTSKIENFSKLEKELNKLESSVHLSNDRLFCFCYKNEILNSEDIGERFTNVFGHIKAKSIISRVVSYLNNPEKRDSDVDYELRKVLFNAEMSTEQPFPLSPDDKVNYFAGQLYAAIARVTGKGIEEAIVCFSSCSPKAFCTDKYTGMYYNQYWGKSYEDIVNKMIEKCEAVLPRWLYVGPIKDPALRILVSATNLFEEDKLFEAYDAYQELYNLTYNKPNAGLSDHAAIMCARCEARLRKMQIFTDYHPENNEIINSWLLKAARTYAYEMRQGLIERANQQNR